MQRTALTIFEGLARTYDSVVEWATLFQDRRWKRWAAEHLDEVTGEVLDVGCGTLLFEERFAGSSRKFVGVDLTLNMARAGLQKRLPNLLMVVNGDAERLPFPDERFQAVVSCYAAKYVDLDRFAVEVARVSRPGALLVLYDFAKPRGPLAPFLELYIQGALRILGGLLGIIGKPSASTYSILPRIIDRSTWDRKIIKVMEGNGFKTLAAERLTGGVVYAYCGRKGS